VSTVERVALKEHLVGSAMSIIQRAFLPNHKLQDLLKSAKSLCSRLEIKQRKRLCIQLKDLGGFMQRQNFDEIYYGIAFTKQGDQ